LSGAFTGEKLRLAHKETGRDTIGVYDILGKPGGTVAQVVKDRFSIDEIEGVLGINEEDSLSAIHHKNIMNGMDCSFTSSFKASTHL
jgi:hypothetical protein